MTSCVSLNGAPLSVAIILPTYNRPGELRQCLLRLSMLMGGPFRTVVVDDGSKVPVGAVCAPFGRWVEVTRRENGGPAAARNTGALAAAGADLLAFIDDDCLPDPAWILRLAKAQAGVHGRLVGGRVVNALPENVCSSASQALCSYLYEYYQATDSDLTFFTSNNLCCRRDDFLARGGFDETFPIPAGEDRDFAIRWQHQGGQLVYAADAVIGHAHYLTLAKFWRQHRNYGRGARQLHLSMERRGDGRPRLERSSFYLGMFSYPFRTSSRQPMMEALLLAVSQAAMVSGYFGAVLEERRERPAERMSA